MNKLVNEVIRILIKPTTFFENEVNQTNFLKRIVNQNSIAKITHSYLLTKIGES